MRDVETPGPPRAGDLGAAPDKHRERLALALDCARQAAKVILTHFSPLGCRAQTKSDGSPVTIADLAAEELIRQRLAHACPDDSVLGEEHADHTGSSDWRWVIDPIDGTRSFVSGVPLFGTMIAAQQRGARGVWEPRVGVVLFPALGETIYASVGAGCFHQRRRHDGDEPPVRVGVSRVDALDQALLCVTSPSACERELRPGAYARLSAGVKASRGWGDCFGHALVACARAELMVDTPMKLWDVAALEPIIGEAGGRLTDLLGGPVDDGSRGALASNGLLHDRALAMLNA
jgi:histidinol-phosphatase